jgi:hypothetical protein
MGQTLNEERAGAERLRTPVASQRYRLASAAGNLWQDLLRYLEGKGGEICDARRRVKIYAHWSRSMLACNGGSTPNKGIAASARARTSQDVRPSVTQTAVFDRIRFMNRSG